MRFLFVGNVAEEFFCLVHSTNGDDSWKEIQNESPSPFHREMSLQIKSFFIFPQRNVVQISKKDRALKNCIEEEY